MAWFFKQSIEQAFYIIQHPAPPTVVFVFFSWVSSLAVLNPRYLRLGRFDLLFVRFPKVGAKVVYFAILLVALFLYGRRRS